MTAETSKTWAQNENRGISAINEFLMLNCCFLKEYNLGSLVKFIL